MDRKKAVEITRELSEKYNLKVDAEEKVEDISLAIQQKPGDLKALYRGAHVLILDEPTAVLRPRRQRNFLTADALSRKRTYDHFHFP